VWVLALESLLGIRNIVMAVAKGDFCGASLTDDTDLRLPTASELEAWGSDEVNAELLRDYVPSNHVSLSEQGAWKSAGVADELLTGPGGGYGTHTPRPFIQRPSLSRGSSSSPYGSSKSDKAIAYPSSSASKLDAIYMAPPCPFHLVPTHFYLSLPLNVIIEQADQTLQDIAEVSSSLDSDKCMVRLSLFHCQFSFPSLQIFFLA